MLKLVLMASDLHMVKYGACCNNSKFYHITGLMQIDHSWMKDSLQQADESCDCENISCSQLDLGGGSFSTPFISRNQDISFSSESPLIVGIQGFSPAVSCKSSFSSFLVEAATPCSVSGRFSFSSCCESNSLIFTSPVSSMPSFAFFGPSSPVEQLNNSLSFAVDTTQADEAQRDNCLKKFLMPSESSICLGSEVKITAFETQRGGGPTGSSKALGIRSKRNRTIGLGEFEQLDLMVTESVIRWASCTHLPSAASLRSSLVC
ncbi:Calcium-dependent protein kinase [Thalictrum thalictroides]|uniref:Calcium-dependent protein kinase n=1 Tax=Thalictrum thalictroides TaxID=46969 RepID=A0A7J6WUA9_THATH|nr:Calcium-dependent protein kinase [Thalictrum thalictroides]